MGGVALHVCGQVQQFMLVQLFRVDGRDGEDAFGERAGLVEDHRFHAGECVQEGRTLDEDALPGGAADAAEEGEGHADDQRARAGDDQEHQGPVDPGGPFTREQRGKDGQQHGQADHDGGIDARKARDEMFAVRFVLGGVLDELEDARGGGFAEGLGGPDAQHAAEVDAAREDFVARGDAARQAFARQRHGVQRGIAFQYDAVHRDFLAGADQNGLADGDALGRDRQYGAVPLDLGRIGANVHQMAHGAARAALCDALEELADLEEKHDEDRFGELGLSPREETDGERAQRGDAHQEILVQCLAVCKGLGGFLQGVPADEEVGDQKEQQVLPGRPVCLFFDEYRADQQGRGRSNLDETLLGAVLIVMMLMVVMFVCHIAFFLFSDGKGSGMRTQPGCK